MSGLHNNFTNTDFNNNNSNTNRNNSSSGRKTQKELLQILNSQKPDQTTQTVPLINTNITDEDVAFLKAANEVIKMHEHRVDPTIRDILNRLQYSNSPHGGMPISMQYLKSIGATENDNDLRERMSLLSTNESFNNGNAPSRHDSIMSHITDYNSNDHHQFNNGNSATTSPSYVVPPFTENPLRNPPTSLDFPQFSLDIFKSNDDLQSSTNSNSQRSQQQQQLQNLLAQNLTANLTGIPNGTDDTQSKISSLLNYPIYNNSNNNNNNNQSDNDIGDDDEEGEEDDEDEDEDDDDDESEPGYMGDRRKAGSNKKNKGHNHAHQLDSNGDVLRNYKCSNCGISFKRSSDLKRHEKIHLKVPPNICPLCHKGFARKDALKRHVDTLTCKRNRQRLLKQLEEEKNGGIISHM